jgi:hypothetical protein
VLHHSATLRTRLARLGGNTSYLRPALAARSIAAGMQNNAHIDQQQRNSHHTQAAVRDTRPASSNAAPRTHPQPHTAQPEEDETSDSADPIQRWADRVSLLELWLTRERQDNVALRRRAQLDAQERASLAEQVECLTRAERAHLDAMQQQRASHYQLHQRWEQLDLQARMASSAQTLSNLGIEAVPSRIPFHASAASMMAKTNSELAVVSPINSHGGAANSAESATAAVVQQLQQELKHGKTTTQPRCQWQQGGRIAHTNSFAACCFSLSQSAPVVPSSARCTPSLTTQSTRCVTSCSRRLKSLSSYNRG